MNNILISIKPEYANLILNHTKKYEFRRTIAKKDISMMYIYSSYPVKKVVAKATIKNIIAKSPYNLWKETRTYAGISRKDFFNYFLGKTTAYAYEIGEVKILKKPKTLAEYGIFTPPQSFIYLK